MIAFKPTYVPTHVLEPTYSVVYSTTECRVGLIVMSPCHALRLVLIPEKIPVPEPVEEKGGKKKGGGASVVPPPSLEEDGGDVSEAVSTTILVHCTYVRTGIRTCVCKVYVHMCVHIYVHVYIRM